MRASVAQFTNGLALVIAMMAALVLLLTTTDSKQAAATAAGICGPMDIAFILDDTGSMNDPLNDVKFGVNEILGDIKAASGGDYRIALLTLRNDITSYDEVVVRNNFADDNALTIKFNILGLTADGGFNEAEASDEALRTVIHALPAGIPDRFQNVDFRPAFRDDAAKLVVLLTDARPGGADDTFQEAVDLPAAHERAVEAAERGIRISAVQVPPFATHLDATIAAVMQDYAAVTGGSYFRTGPAGDGAADAIRAIIARCGGGPEGPDLTVTTVPSPGQPDPVPGAIYSFSVRVANVGKDSTPQPPANVMLRQDLAGLGSLVSWRSSSGICANKAGSVDCTRGQMAPGDEWVIDFRVRLHRNAGCALGAEAEADPWGRIAEAHEYNNTSTHAVAVCPAGGDE